MAYVRAQLGAHLVCWSVCLGAVAGPVLAGAPPVVEVTVLSIDAQAGFVHVGASATGFAPGDRLLLMEHADSLLWLDYAWSDDGRAVFKGRQPLSATTKASDVAPSGLHGANRSMASAMAARRA